MKQGPEPARLLRVEKDANKHPHNNFDSLKSAIKQMMVKMDKTMLTKACARFKPRIEAVIDAEGDSSSEVWSGQVAISHPSSKLSSKVLTFAKKLCFVWSIYCLHLSAPPCILFKNDICT